MPANAGSVKTPDTILNVKNGKYYMDKKENSFYSYVKVVHLSLEILLFTDVPASIAITI